MVVPWSDLPADLLQSIADILVDNLVDYVRFRAVCISWRSSTVDPHNLKRLFPDQLPWALRLLDDDNRGDIVTFLRLSDCKTVDMSVPEIRGDRNIVGSADGWLAVVDLTVPAVRLVLINPLTRAQIHLPPLASMYEIRDAIVTLEWFGGHILNVCVEGLGCTLVRKVVFSEDHTVVMVYIACFDILAFVGPGDEQWTMINLPPRFFLLDIVHHKGSFYVVDDRGRLAICNLAPPASVTPVASVQVVDKEYFCDWFLVSSGEELLLIAQQYVKGFNSSLGFGPRRKFQVFRLEYPSSKRSVLLEVKSLGDRILFLGTNRSLCLSARDCPAGYKPDSIYIAISNYFEKCCEFGFCNLEDGCFYLKHLEQQFTPSTWFTPSLC